MYKEIIENQNHFKVMLKQYNYTIYKIDNYITRFNVFKELINKRISINEAANKLGLSKSQIKKIKKKIIENGYITIIHKLKGVQRAKKFDDKTIKLLVSLYSGSYAKEIGELKYDFSESNYSNFHRHLTHENGDLREFGLEMSLSHLRNVLNKEDFISVASKKFKKTHNHKGRRFGITYLPGERWETDGTFEDWFDDGNTRAIHAIYDRGLEAPIALYMDDQETTKGYYEVFKEGFKNYGVPKKLISDRRATFYNVSTKDASKKYDTRFNNMLDNFNVEYEYTSNSNGKPGVESFNKDLKTNFINDLKRHNIKTVEEANEYLKKYVLFKQKAINMKKENKHGRKISENEFLDIATTKRKNMTIGKKGRIYSANVEYELLKNNKIVQLSKGTNVKLTESINGKKYVYLKKQRYEAVVSTKVKKEAYAKIEMKEKELKIKEDMTIHYKGTYYVILKNNGKHLELDTYTKVLYQEKEGNKKVFYKGKAYSIVPKEEYAFEYKIRSRKECGVKFHCLVRYERKDYVLVDNDNKIVYQPEVVNKLFIKYYIDGLYSFVDSNIVSKLQLLSEYIGSIPNSYLQAKRYRNQK